MTGTTRRQIFIEALVRAERALRTAVASLEFADKLFPGSVGSGAIDWAKNAADAANQALRGALYDDENERARR